MDSFENPTPKARSCFYFSTSDGGSDLSLPNFCVYQVCMWLPFWGSKKYLPI